MPQDKLDQVRQDYEAAGMTPEDAPDDFELRKHNPDISDFEEMVENYAQGGGWYELPGGNKVRGKKSAVAVLETHLKNEDGAPQYVCVQHPTMTVYGPQGKLGAFVNGTFEPRDGVDIEDEKVQAVLDDTPYVMREN